MAIAEELKILVKAEVNKAVSDMNRFNTATQKSKMGIQSLSSRIGKWVVGLGTAAIAVRTLRKAMQYAFDASQYAAQFTQVEKAFQNIASQAGSSADRVLESIREMSLGTISDLKLMTATSRAALFDIPLDKLDELMKISMASATAMGQSVEYMFDSIVTGIGRGQPLILDNLGLTLKVGEATKQYASELGKTAEELTANERKTAILNATLEAGAALYEKVGDVALEMTDAQRIEKYKAAMENLKKEIGLGLLPAFKEATVAATELVTKLTEQVRLIRIVKEMAKGTATLKDELWAVTQQIKEYEDAVESGNIFKAELYAGQLKALRERQKLLEDLIKRQEYQAAREQAHNDKKNKQIQDAIAKEEERAKNEKNAIDAIMAAYAQTEAGKREELQKTIEKYEEYAQTYPDMAPMIKAVLDDLQLEWDELNGKIETAKVTLEHFNDASLIDFNVGEGGFLGISDESKEFARELMENMDSAVTATDHLMQSLSTASEYASKAWDAGIKNAGEYADKLEELQAQSKEASNQVISAIGPFTSAVGQMFTDSAKGMDMLKEATKGAIASTLEMLAQEAFAKAAFYMGLGLIPGMQANIPGAIAMGAAGTGALLAAGIVRGMKEGGIVTRPTNALIGEAGPEAVIPLDKAGGFGGPSIVVVQNIRGSVLTERQIQRFAMGGMMRASRGY